MKTVIELIYLRRICCPGRNLCRATSLALTCVGLIAGFDFSAALANDEARVNDRLQALVRNGNRIVPTDVGPRDAADLHRACVLRNEISACTELIDNGSEDGFATRWAVGTAHLTRGIWSDTRGDLDLALSDYDRAEELTEKYPELQDQIAKLKNSIATMRNYSAQAYPITMRAVAKIDWDEDPFRHPWIGATREHDVRLENSNAAAANSMSMDGACIKPIFFRPDLCEAPHYARDTPPVALAFARYLDTVSIAQSNVSSAIETGSLPNRRAREASVSSGRSPIGLVTNTASDRQFKSDTKTAMLVPKRAVEPQASHVAEQRRDNTETNLPGNLHNVRADTSRRPYSIRDSRPETLWSLPNISAFLLVLTLCGLGVIFVSKRSTRQDFELAFERNGPPSPDFATMQNFAVPEKIQKDPPAPPTRAVEPSGSIDKRLFLRNVDWEAPAKSTDPVTVFEDSGPSLAAPAAPAETVIPIPEVPELPAGTASAATISAPVEETALQVKKPSGNGEDSNLPLRPAPSPQVLDRLVHDVARDVCIEALRKSGNLMIGDQLALCMFDASRQLMLAELGSPKSCIGAEARRETPGQDNDDASGGQLGGAIKRDADISAEWAELLVGIWVMLLDHLPNGALTMAIRSTSGSAETRLIHLIEDPFSLLGALEKDVCSHEATQAGYFAELRDALAGNLQSVLRGIGGDNGEACGWSGHDTNLAARSDIEQVRHFLGNTPFRGFLETNVVSLPRATEKISNCRVIADQASSRNALAAQLFAPKMPQIEAGDASAVFIDSRGEMSDEIRRVIKQNSRSPMGHRLRVIHPSNPSDAGLFNPFGYDLNGFDPFATEKLLGAAFDLQCFVLEAFLGVDFTQDNRSQLRHITRLHHHIPNATFETLIDLLDVDNFGTYEKYVSSIASASSREFFATKFHSYGFLKVAERLRQKLADLLSDEVFKIATCGKPWGGDGNHALSAGKISLYDLSCENICSVRQHVLKRICITKIVFEALAARETEALTLQTHIYMDNFGELFCGSAADLDMLLKQIQLCGSELVLGYEADNQLAPGVQDLISKYCPAKFEGAKHESPGAHFKGSANSFLASLRAARGNARENNFALTV